jgi:hypothetical protein
MNTSRTLAFATLSFVCGCSVITNANDFEEREPPLACGNDLGSPIVDMRLDLTDMNAHTDNLVMADLVQVGPAMRRQVGRVIYDPLGSANLQLELPCAVQDGNHDVDLVADLTGDRMFQPCDPVGGGLSCGDHQWRLRLQADGRLAYQHDTDFTDVIADRAVPRGALPLQVLFRNLQPFEGMMMEVRIRLLDDNGESKSTIFIYRRQQIPEMNSEFGMQSQENLVMRGERFKVAVWIDLNGNGSYDPPSDDRNDRDYATLIDGLADAPSITPPDPGGLRVIFDGNALPPATDVLF